jgi:hypothetical protein
MRQWLRFVRTFDDVSENSLSGPGFSQLALLFRATLVEIVPTCSVSTPAASAVTAMRMTGSDAL